MTELDTRVARLKEAGTEFSATFNRLLGYRESARLDARAKTLLGKLLHEGTGIMAAIQTATRLIDGAKRWVGRTFQTDAMETIPFAPEIVANTAAGATATIEHFQEKVRGALPAFEALKQKYAALPEENRSALAAVETTLPPPDTKPALFLLALIGALIWWVNRKG